MAPLVEGQVLNRKEVEEMGWRNEQVSHRRVRGELGRQRRDELEDVLLSPAVMASCVLVSVDYKDNEDDNNMLPRMTAALQLYISIRSPCNVTTSLKHLGSRRWRFDRHATLSFILI